MFYLQDKGSGGFDRVANRKIIPGDDTPFVTEEDYDYMLLVTNVLQEPRRRGAYFRRPSVL